MCFVQSWVRILQCCVLILVQLDLFIHSFIDYLIPHFSLMRFSLCISSARQDTPPAVHSFLCRGPAGRCLVPSFLSLPAAECKCLPPYYPKLMSWSFTELRWVQELRDTILHNPNMEMHHLFDPWLMRVFNVVFDTASHYSAGNMLSKNDCLQHKGQENGWSSYVAARHKITDVLI